MEEYTRTDLALEGRDRVAGEIRGIRNRTYESGGVTFHELCVTNEEGANAIGKPQGTYVTLTSDKLWELEGEAYEQVCAALSGAIRKLACEMTGKSITENFGVLVAGLGNEDIASDAIGPMTVKHLTVTRHIRTLDPAIFGELGSCAVSAFAPGVLGQTGIETVELVRGAAENAAPDVVVAVDALAARNCDRLGRTVQLASTGISPGSGIGNTRKAINADTLGYPVLSVGVPTVVDSSTLVYDALEKAGIQDVSPALETVLEQGKSFFVTLKETDVMADSTARLLSDAIGRAFVIRPDEA